MKLRRFAKPFAEVLLTKAEEVSDLTSGCASRCGIAKSLGGWCRPKLKVSIKHTWYLYCDDFPSWLLWVLLIFDSCVSVPS